MKFTLTAPERSHGIKVIGSIPDHALCQVEGLNGVGKTLALHLLELCTGQQPYRTRPAAWATLCRYLGPTEVTVEGLSGRTDDGSDEAHTLRFAFDWREHADAPMPREVTSGQFDEITLDGFPVDMDDVRRWLSVVRIAGNENLTETVAEIVAHDMELLRAASRVAHSRAAHADRMLAEELGSFPAEPARRALEISHELESLTRSSADAAEQREHKRQLLERLELAHAAYAAVANVTANETTLRDQLDRLRKQFEDAQARTKETDEALLGARERELLSAEATKKLASAQRSFQRRLSALRKATAAAEEAANRLGISALTEQIASARAEAERERTEVARQRADLADIFALRDLLEGLVQALAPAAAGGLRARTVAVVREQTLTAGDLLDAVRNRRERLIADAPAVDELDQRLGELESRLGELNQVERLIADHEDKHGKLVEAEKALEGLGQGDDSSEDLVGERAAAHAAAQRVEIEIASAVGATEGQLVQLGGGLSLEDLQAQLERRLVEAGTTRAQLDEDLRDARGRLVTLDDKLDAASAQRDELEATAGDLARILVEQANALHAEEAHAPLRAMLDDRAPDPGHGLADLARAWIAVHEAADRAVRRLQSARGDLDELLIVMKDLVDVIRHERHAGPELDRVRRLYETRMQEQLAQPEVLKALFDSGELTRVDLAAREVRWKTPGGEPRLRPFEAFSSGERAFAYVRARLAGAAELTAHNRVVAVDEFGAFLSRDRLIRLQEVIERQLSDGIVHQAIVVLPLLRPRDAERSEESTVLAASEQPGEYVTGVFDALAVG